MSRNNKITIGVVTSLITILVGTALALSNISLNTGTTPAPFDFGDFGGEQIGTVQIQEFTVKPGDPFPWHHHKAVSYVILERGTLTETHIDPNTFRCVSTQFQAGAGFVELAGQPHTIKNTGRDSAEIQWATVYPQGDPILQVSPEFQSGGIYLEDPQPTCQQ